MSMYEKKWHSIHAWLPHNLISTAPQGEIVHLNNNNSTFVFSGISNSSNIASQQRDLLLQLVNKVLPKCHENDAIEVVNEMKAKVKITAVSSSIHENTNHGSEASSASASGMKSLGSNIDFCRAQIAILSNTLRIQEGKALKSLVGSALEAAKVAKELTHEIKSS
jgi:hypothetical protein